MHRKDDNPETVRERLRVYHRETEPLVVYYESGGCSGASTAGVTRTRSGRRSASCSRPKLPPSRPRCRRAYVPACTSRVDAGVSAGNTPPPTRNGKAEGSMSIVTVLIIVVVVLLVLGLVRRGRV